jgi:TonB family protein
MIYRGNNSIHHHLRHDHWRCGLVLLIALGFAPASIFAQDSAPEQPSSPETEVAPKQKSEPTPSTETSEVEANQDTGPKLTKAPTVIEFVQAQYPDAAKAQKLAGDVIVAITINLDGSVSDPDIVQPLSPELDAAALTAIAQFKFEPAEFDNAPTVVRIQYRYTFTLEKEVIKTPKTTQADVKTGRLVGTLFERGKRKKMVGVEVKIGTDLTTFTDEAGRFIFESVPVGTVTVEVEDADFEAIVSKEDIVENEETDVTYYVPRKGFEDAITVRATRLKKRGGETNGYC